MGERVTLSELARRLGFNRAYIHKLKLRGMLPFDDAGLIDEDIARAAIEANKDPDKAYMAEVNQRQRESGGYPREPPGEAAPSNNVSYMKAKTMREAFAAKIAQLDYKERCGELVDAQSVAKAITDAASIIQTSLERVPDRLAERVAAESDAAICHTLLTGEMDAMLAELTALCDRMAAQVKP